VDREQSQEESKTARKYWQSPKGKSVKRRSRLKVLCWTPEGWDKAYEEQGGVCAICGHDSTDGKSLHSDHDHEHKIPRGLLCNECNLMLGKARDNPFILEAAAKYLRKYSDAPQENS
jgi:hypothetical protein